MPKVVGGLAVSIWTTYDMIGEEEEDYLPEEGPLMMMADLVGGRVPGDDLRNSVSQLHETGLEGGRDGRDDSSGGRVEDGGAELKASGPGDGVPGGDPNSTAGQMSSVPAGVEEPAAQGGGKDPAAAEGHQQQLKPGSAAGDQGDDPKSRSGAVSSGSEGQDADPPHGADPAEEGAAESSDGGSGDAGSKDGVLEVGAELDGYEDELVGYSQCRLKELLVECEEGNVAMLLISKFVLCLYARSDILPLGGLRYRLRAVAHQLRSLNELFPQ